MDIDQTDLRFGTVAVIKAFVTKDQLIDALSLQVSDNVEQRQHRPIGQILHENGLLTDDQINDVLKTMQDMRKGK